MPKLFTSFEENLNKQPIVCVVSDGTNVNVGSGNGAIRRLEFLLGNPLHYFICQLHRNEQPFRAVFYHNDGKPSCPEHWRGPIGKQIKETFCVSRCNALWINILRLCRATSRPNHELKTIVMTIMKFSAPMWFYIKMHPHETLGSRIIFHFQLCRKNLNKNDEDSEDCPAKCKLRPHRSTSFNMCTNDCQRKRRLYNKRK